VLPQPIVIVTTVDGGGRVNAALKSWVMYCSPRDIMLGCNLNHDTAKNILETGEFVVNMPGMEILDQTFITAAPYPRGVNEIEEAGLTAIPSSKVRPPRVKECKAHAECKKVWHKSLGDGAIIFVGRVVALSVDEDVIDEEKMCLKTRDLRQMLLVPEGAGTGKLVDLPKDAVIEQAKRGQLSEWRQVESTETLFQTLSRRCGIGIVRFQKQR
jgi:flavin reductase (DIM6/NTAB) family NADH-FMN oxidoreductase RutF